MKKKVISWAHRYLPAEASALIGAISGGALLHTLTGNSIITALGGTWGENIGFYGFIIARDLFVLTKKHSQLSLVVLTKLIRNLLVEFGPAEYLDSFVVRPFTMYLIPILLQNLLFGLVVGKLVADVVFYIPTIISFEFRKNRWKD